MVSLMAAAEACLTFDVEPPKWRVLDVVVGTELAEDDFCDNSITTSKHRAEWERCFLDARRGAAFFSF